MATFAIFITLFAFVGAFVYAALITGKPRHHY